MCRLRRRASHVIPTARRARPTRPERDPPGHRVGDGLEVPQGEDAGGDSAQRRTAPRGGAAHRPPGPRTRRRATSAPRNETGSSSASSRLGSSARVRPLPSTVKLSVSASVRSRQTPVPISSAAAGQRVELGARHVDVDADERWRRPSTTAPAQPSERPVAVQHGHQADARCRRWSAPSRPSAGPGRSGERGSARAAAEPRGRRGSSYDESRVRPPRPRRPAYAASAKARASRRPRTPDPTTPRGRSRRERASAPEDRRRERRGRLPLAEGEADRAGRAQDAVATSGRAAGARRRRRRGSARAK